MERLRAVRTAPAVAPGPQTLVAKILARHAVANADSDGALQVGQGCFVRPDLRFIHDIYTAMCRFMLRSRFGDALVLHEPDSILTFEDHFSYAHRSHAHVSRGLLGHVAELSAEHRAFVAEHGLRDHGYAASGEGSEGISHALIAEQYALPVQLITSTNSHTPHSGALGCLAFGVGTTDMANAMVRGVIRLAVPDVLRIELEGIRPVGVSAKDIVLHLLARPDLRAGLGVGRVFEFAGPGIAQFDTDERATLTNMTTELGGFSGIVAPDSETIRFIRERRGVDIVIEDWMCSDPGAAYDGVITVDLSALVPMVAAPGDPGNGVDLARLAEPVRIDIAYGGSCTAGEREDFDRYHEVLVWALRHGLALPAHVTLFLQFGTKAVPDYCEAQGYIETFAKLGAEILQPACGACANCGPGTSVQSGQVTVSAVNRNFPGRFGPGRVWLASPATVAASAIAGELISFEALQARFSNG